MATPSTYFNFELVKFEKFAQGLHDHFAQNTFWASKVCLDHYADELTKCAVKINAMLTANSSLILNSCRVKSIQVPVLLTKKIEIARFFFPPTNAKQDLLNYLQLLINESKELQKMTNKEDSGKELVSFKSIFSLLVFVVMLIYLKQKEFF